MAEERFDHPWEVRLRPSWNVHLPATSNPWAEDDCDRMELEAFVEKRS